MNITGKSVVELVVGYFGKYTDAPNSALVRDISNEIRASNPTIPEDAVFEETILKLRTDFGYGHPIEEQADRNDAAPFLAKTSHRGNARERE